MCLFVCFKRKLVIFDELCIFEVKTRDFHLNGGFSMRIREIFA